METGRTGPGIPGRAAVITGASRGLGLATAGQLAFEGWDLALCARGGEQLERAAQGLRERYGRRVYARSADVTDTAALDGFIDSAADRLGGVDALVTCVGGAFGGGLAEASAEDWADTYRINVEHPARAVRTALPYLRRSGGRVVLVASISGWKPGPPAQYAAAKAGQIHLAATLARELGPDGVRVNAVSPGSMLIPGKGWDRLRKEHPERYRVFEREFPGGELVSPEDVAAVIAFLVSDRARAVNGANIPVDGGQNAPSAYGY
ncbi:SDR family NAD(P)-dependent oxidoreductase [Streptomyces yaizuensis]|uniref:SDR family oxidoreductase n=1 Tax=Streptomyces yaizuensis TaxID=2989713 RepID=A0ABQ5P352_9ACTN|nr:SDR family oxidoreductase [Streptomyces sp. YSPA8]GLF97033.1 SDR family oxidoreductase [Streptomyces sp. YSPA8]